ncbi:uncharacterized protein LOC134842212 [Symsagittifera roscoffensis]|uniref:uncharacterized protein LOC134842212 n=1 Tax=Symsagittifera roscoffensis TaxID=84072 RepID=UPI00307BDF13
MEEISKMFENKYKFTGLLVMASTAAILLLYPNSNRYNTMPKFGLPTIKHSPPPLTDAKKTESQRNRGVENYTQVNHSKESMNAVAIEKTVKIPCSELDTTLRKTGYWFGDCRGNLGNQVLVLGTGLNMYLQSGAKLVIGKSHADKLRAAFDVEKICKDDGSTFCIIWPQGCKMDTARMKYYTKDDGFLEAVTSKLDFVGNAFNAFLCPAPLGILANAYHNMFKHQMPFKDPIWSGAKLVYDSLKKSAVCDAEDKSTGCTMVFLHMRMDNCYHKGMLKHPDRFPNLYDKTDYIQQATRHASITYKTSTIFVVGYNDRDVSTFFKNKAKGFEGLKIVLTTLERSKLIKDPKTFPAIDMALLSMADVMIMTAGTYGMSGALLGKEKLVVFLPDYYGMGFNSTFTNARFKRIAYKQWQ